MERRCLIFRASDIIHLHYDNISALHYIPSKSIDRINLDSILSLSFSRSYHASIFSIFKIKGGKRISTIFDSNVGDGRIRKIATILMEFFKRIRFFLYNLIGR